MYDGTGMMVDFLQWLDRDVRDDEEDFHLEVLTELKRHPLPNNCTESQLTARIGDFTANHNPLLGRHKLEGEALSRFIIKSLPESLEQSKAAFLSELKRDKAWAADYHAVLERCAELIRQVHRKTEPVPTLGLFGVNGIAYAPPPDNRRPPAMLTKEKENNPTGRLPRNRLPDGQMCASGTCPFKHKGDCWRDPRKKVTLPSAMSEATRTTIKEARAENAKRLKVTAQPCQGCHISTDIRLMH